MSIDRADGYVQGLDYTQKRCLLSSLRIGVRRVGVTKAAGSLQRKNLISYIRGSLIIHDINGLKAVSCVCYEADIKTYNNMM